MSSPAREIRHLQIALEALNAHAMNDQTLNLFMASTNLLAALPQASPVYRVRLTARGEGAPICDRELDYVPAPGDLINGPAELGGELEIIERHWNWDEEIPCDVILFVDSPHIEPEPYLCTRCEEHYDQHANDDLACPASRTYEDVITFHHTHKYSGLAPDRSPESRELHHACDDFAIRLEDGSHKYSCKCGEILRAPNGPEMARRIAQHESRATL